MIQFILLDASPLGLVTQRKGVALADACRRWVDDCLARNAKILVPEIADYEVRRELLRADKSAGMVRLDEFNAAEHDRYLPITTAVMRLAASFWAEARRRGQPTAPDPSLDADSILAAQAATLDAPRNSVVVATTNVGHLSRFVPAALWNDISL
jgi:predicted nucleic acid-binding protein